MFIIQYFQHSSSVPVMISTSCTEARLRFWRAHHSIYCEPCERIILFTTRLSVQHSLTWMSFSFYYNNIIMATTISRKMQRVMEATVAEFLSREVSEDSSLVEGEVKFCSITKVFLKILFQLIHSTSFYREFTLILM